MDLPDDWHGRDRVQKMKYCIEQADQWLIDLADIMSLADEGSPITPADAVGAGAWMAQAWMKRAEWAQRENL